MAWYAGQVVLLAALTAAFLMLGVVSGQSLRLPLDESERKVFKTALALAMVGVVLQAGVGLGTQNKLSRYQPARMAATDAYWRSGAPNELALVALPAAALSGNRGAWIWRRAGGPWLTKDSQGRPWGLAPFHGTGPLVARPV